MIATDSGGLTDALLSLGRIAALARYGQAIVIDRVAWYVYLSVCLSAGLSVTTVSPTRTAEPIEVPFGM